MKFICFLFLGFLFSFGFAFLYCNHVGVFFFFCFFFKVDLKESIYVMQLFLLQVYFLQSLYLSVSIGTLQLNSGTVVYLRDWFFQI
jgi:hypothetical protein